VHMFNKIRLWWLKRGMARHESANAQCPHCPEHWPNEHENCGGLFHANSQITRGETVRWVACDKCGLHAELSVIQINHAAPDLSPETIRRTERAILKDLTRRHEVGTNREHGDLQENQSFFTSFRVHDGLQKLYDFTDHLRDSMAMQMAEYGCEVILKALQEFEGKARQAGIDPEAESCISTALRAVLELERRVRDGISPVITDGVVARIFVQSLETDLEDLQEHERQLSAEGKTGT
jgi:hypothetical protein